MFIIEIRNNIKLFYFSLQTETCYVIQIGEKTIKINGLVKKDLLLASKKSFSTQIKLGKSQWLAIKFQNLTKKDTLMLVMNIGLDSIFKNKLIIMVNLRLQWDLIQLQNTKCYIHQNSYFNHNQTEL
jgi:hypothetical protein